jgi:hypothetical protein
MFSDSDTGEAVALVGPEWPLFGHAMVTSDSRKAMDGRAGMDAGACRDARMMDLSHGANPSFGPYGSATPFSSAAAHVPCRTALLPLVGAIRAAYDSDAAARLQLVHLAHRGSDLALLIADLVFLLDE